MTDRDTRDTRDTRATLDCDAIAPYLAPFADGELAEPLRTQVATHISGCPHCAQRLDRIRDMDALLSRLPQTTPSVGVFERTLAAARASASPDPRAVTREALPGMNGARLRRRLREIIARDASTDGVGERSGEGGLAPGAAALGAGGRRTSWVAAAIPAIAALLLISLTLTLFLRLPGGTSQGGASSHQTPSASDPLRQTRDAVGAVAGQLAFRPVTPGYLPSGASAARVAVGPEQVDAISRYLDISWTFNSGPAQSLHLRELPTGLGFYGYAPLATPTAPLGWSLPSMSGWQALTVGACATCLAVGEAQGNIRLALDAQPRAGASADAVVAWLRLVSLSLDMPYLPLGVTLSSPTSAEALHYLATISDGQGHAWSWDVSVAGATASQQNARIIGNGVDVSEVINNGSAARLNNLSHIYQPLAPPLPSALPPSSVTQPLFAPNAFIAAGELWNLGPRQVALPDGRTLKVIDLYWVNAAQPEHLYAEANTGQVIALVVTTPSSVHPGGANGDTNFVSASACPTYTVTYTFITYMPPTQLPARLFDTQPSGWRQGTVAPSVTCRG